MTAPTNERRDWASAGASIAPGMPTTENPGYQVPLNPVDVEALIDDIRQRIARGVRFVSDAEEEATNKGAAYDRAYAHAFLAHDGPQTEKKVAAEVDPAVIKARDERDVADLAFRHARRGAESLRDQLSALQSISKSMIAMYGAERGVGS